MKNLVLLHFGFNTDAAFISFLIAFSLLLVFIYFVKRSKLVKKIGAKYLVNSVCGNLISVDGIHTRFEFDNLKLGNFTYIGLLPIEIVGLTTDLKLIARIDESVSFEACFHEKDKKATAFDGIYYVKAGENKVKSSITVFYHIPPKKLGIDNLYSMFFRLNHLGQLDVLFELKK